MTRGLAVVTVFVAAFILLIGLLALFAGIATTFPTTEESFFKFGPELEGAALAVVGAAVVGLGVFLTWLAGRFSVPRS